MHNFKILGSLCLQGPLHVHNPEYCSFKIFSRLRFLQARDAWLIGVLAAIVEGPDPHQHLSKVMDTTRVHLFDIVTQYRALFSDDDVIGITNFSPSSAEFGDATSNLFQG